MKVIGITLVKNEQDLIPFTLKHMFNQGMDEIIVMDNFSTDDTVDVLSGMIGDGYNICLMIDDHPGFLMQRKVNFLADQARRHNADWVVPFDADELWYAESGNKLTDEIRRADLEGYNVMVGNVFNHFPTALDIPNENPYLQLGWHWPQAFGPKVGFKVTGVVKVGYGQHSVHLQDGNNPDNQAFSQRHFPYRSEEQFAEKIFKGIETRNSIGEKTKDAWQMYYEIYLDEGMDSFLKIFRKNFYFEDPEHDQAPGDWPNAATLHMMYDPAPYAG